MVLIAYIGEVEANEQDINLIIHLVHFGTPNGETMAHLCVSHKQKLIEKYFGEM